jgi:AcrR family transcriptional regulator
MAATPKGKVPRQVREREMLAVARRSFAKYGFEESSMDEIAEAAGISKPMLYNYFGSKGGLFYACVREEAEELFDAVRDAANATDVSPEQRLWRGFVAFFAWIDDNREGWRVVYLEATRSAAIEASGSWARARMAELLGDLLTQTAVGEGISPTMRPHIESLAHMLTWATMASADYWLEHQDEPRDLQALRLMNFCWVGFERMLDGHLWLPSRD